MARQPSLVECGAAGTHLQSVDHDGYCNVCGEQDPTTMGERIVEALQNPDEVSESAYRAVHGEVLDAVQTAHIAEEDDAGIRQLVLAELENLIVWAQQVKDAVEQLPGPIPHSPYALASDPKVYPFVLVDHAGRVRDAYMTEEGAQQDAWQGDTVRPREGQE